MEETASKEFTLCPKFEKSFAILGKKWNGLIIDVLLEQGPLRFGELAQTIPSVSDRVLVERLKELEKEGLVERSALAEEPTRFSYQLTCKGADLQLAMSEIKHWGEKWVKDSECC